MNCQDLIWFSDEIILKMCSTMEIDSLRHDIAYFSCHGWFRVYLTCSYGCPTQGCLYPHKYQVRQKYPSWNSIIPWSLSLINIKPGTWRPCPPKGITPTYQITFFGTRTNGQKLPWDLWQHLTHWRKVVHICVSKLTIIGSDNGLLPGWYKAIIQTSVGMIFILTPRNKLQ